MLSEIEEIYFYLVERRPETYDIQEQWPILDIDRTLELCNQYGVRHPYKGSCPEPFTIDFLLTEVVGDELKCRAASIKTPKDAKDPVVRRRLAIEHAWCQEQGVVWTLVDTKAFDKTMLSALRFMRLWYLNRYQPEPSSELQFSEKFLATYSRNILLGELLQKIATRLHLRDVDAQNIFRYCAWTNLITVSLKHPLSLDKPLVLFRENDLA